MGRESLKAQLRVDEAVRQKLYWDNASPPKATIGVGRNLTDKGISLKAVEFLLDEDVDETYALADKYFPWWRSMTENRQDAFANFLFNVGIGTALGFVNTLKALKENRWEDAARGFEDSLWYRQVGDRAKRIVAKIRNG